MNLVESFVSHSGTDTFLTEAFFNTQKKDFSTSRLGIVTSSISSDNLILSYQNNESNTLKLKTIIILILVPIKWSNNLFVAITLLSQ